MKYEIVNDGYGKFALRRRRWVGWWRYLVLSTESSWGASANWVLQSHYHFPRAWVNTRDLMEAQLNRYTRQGRAK